MTGSNLIILKGDRFQTGRAMYSLKVTGVPVISDEAIAF
jgi:hypothetical protein